MLAGKGYHGAGDHIHVPYRGRNKPVSQKQANRAHAQLRSPGERANAQLKTWRILRKLAAAPGAPGNWPKPSTSCKPAKSQVKSLQVGSGHARPGTPGDRGPVA